ncbi:MAG: hypothetical protein NC127_06775 [Muribaculum sp.]|nr:hypothetical protein [Muribaculum sp.]
MSTVAEGALPEKSDPDFSMPGQQSREELKKLAEYLSEGDTKEAARSAILYDALITAKDPDSIQAAIDTIASVVDDKRVGAPVRALLNLYVATIYSDLYNQRRWIYDGRKQPSEPLPADYNLWNGEQFSQVITGYVDKTLAESDELKKAPLAEYGRVCGLTDKKDLIFYPTLFDFAAYKSIDIFKSLAPAYYLFSFGLLTPTDVYVREQFTYQSPVQKHILELYRQLIEFHRDDTAPLILADVKRIQYIAEHLRRFGRSDEDTVIDEDYYYDPSETHKWTPSPAPKTYSLLMDLYERHRNSPYATEALVAAGEYISTDTETDVLEQYCTLSEAQMKAYPSYQSNGCLYNTVSELKQPNVYVSHPTEIVPGDTLEIEITNRNTPEFVLKVYKVPYPWNGETSYRFKSDSRPQLVKSIPFKATGNAPFRATDSAKLTFDKPGCYIIVPKYPDGSEGDENYSYTYIHCSNLNLSTASFGAERWGIVVNPMTGSPVSGAKIDLVDTNKSLTLESFTTANDGMASLTGKGGRYYVKKGTDTFASPQYSSNYSSFDKERRIKVCPLTDLAIYHPGDTVRWNIVSQSYLLGNAQVEPSLKVRAILRNANAESIDTAEVTTDEWGRANGLFNLPDAGLTGQFSIDFRLVDSEKRHKGSVGSIGFTVSDYKLPTYYVEVTDIQRDSPKKGDVTLKGRALSYSGFPIAMAEIDLSLKAIFRMWGVWRGNLGDDRTFYATTTKTDSNGDFSVELPEQLLKSAPESNPIYVADFTATSSTGETQTTSASFTQGKPNFIRCMLPEVIDIANPVNLDLTMSDLSGKKTVADVRYVIKNSDKQEVASGVVSTANPIADLSGVPGGKYTFIFYPVDSTLADMEVVKGRILYRPTDKTCPLPDATLWVPVKSLTLTGSRHASILYGVTGHENHIHYAVYTDSAMVDQGWLKQKSGMHRFEYDLPEEIDNVTVTLSCTSRYRSADQNVKVSTAESDKSIKLSIESFRDKLTPGNVERWTFRVTDAQGRGIQAPVALDMYAKSIDNLAYRTFTINPSVGQRMRYAIDRGYSLNGSERLATAFHGKNCVPVGVPEYFISMSPFYGVGRMLTEQHVYIRGSRSTADFAGQKMAKVESATYNSAMEESSAVTFAKVNDGEMELDEAIAEMSETDAGAGNADSGVQEAFEYRMPETPLAFFRPSLTTDSVGVLNFTFTVPNANTTWKLGAYTYSRDMSVANLTREAIASKPVMVQPNLPRFMRNGDRVCVMSAVMNNTDSVASVSSTVEIFDPASGRVIATETYSRSMGALESSTISTWVDAPDNANLIGYRVKSTDGHFTDGEQAIIPVLPSVEPVIETTPFYIPAKTTDFSIKLPKMPKDALVTLQFCENPTWYVVTALPGLRDGKLNGALSASAAIFSAAIAEGILRTDPAIAEAIKMWNSSDKSDSTLVSMLQRNADLKTVLLSSTPWVMDAQSQTERMERLALLFDSKTIESTYSEAIKKLSSLVCTDGGWSWIEQHKESSMWITENILGMMGRLRRLGYLPDNGELKAMLDRAVKYYDSQTEKSYIKSPDYTNPLFVMIRKNYPEVAMSATVKNFVNNTLGVVSRNWKQHDIPSKAIDAIILNQNGYSSVAKEIVASIRDFGVSKPDKGLWWPSLDNMTVWSMGKISATALVLDAFTEVEPGSTDIDLIRQWLILQKEAKDWGISVSTSEAISSILLSGSKWTRPAQGSIVSINGRPVAVAKVDSLLGYFREDISSYNPSSAKLSVNKRGDTPSWGAVYSRYRNRMTDISAASCPDLSIEKVLYRRSVSDSGVKWEEAAELKVGDVVQVNLTLTVGRDMDYVAIIDDRGACLEPAEQTPAPIYSEGLCFYRENRDSATNLFITHLPKGTYRLSYEMYVNNAGTFSAGIASAQSQYAPALSAHSSGTTLTVKE